MVDDFQLSREPANPLPGCIGALDGIAIKIMKPRDQPASFGCHKGYYSLPVQAMCDSNYRFTCFSATCTGSTHDSLAHAVSALGKFLDSRSLPIYFWIAGDEAYVCTVALITPVPKTQATDDKDAFNFFHSSTRMHIGQAFGMLMRKWKIRRYLEHSVQDSAEIIGLAMKLHNFCIDNGGRTEGLYGNTEEQERMLQESESWYAEGRERYSNEVNRPGAANREHLINIIKAGGYTRPPIRAVRVPSHLRASPLAA